MRIASKTLTAINEAMVADQGAKFRGLLRQVMPLADDAYSEKESDFRAHLGASLIGRECERELWYSFRWVTLKRFDGRMLRLFNRGHLEEPRFVALLRMIGCTVYQFQDNGKQFRIQGHKSHFGGSLDAVVVGCPDVPDLPILGEFKTHNDKSFQKVKNEGVMAAKWEHFVQMQTYMDYYQLSFGIYMAANKNDDEIHAEIVTADKQYATNVAVKSARIIDARTPPPKINQSPGWFKCKFCDHSQVCHGQARPNKTCRSCANAVPASDGTWFCSLELITLSEEAQLKACKAYEMIPSIKG